MVAATANRLPTPTVSFRLHRTSNAVADGHQMDLSEGRNPVTITVTAEDNTTQDYTVSVNRGVDHRVRLERRARPGRDNRRGHATRATFGPTAQPFGCQM